MNEVRKIHRIHNKKHVNYLQQYKISILQIHRIQEPYRFTILLHTQHRHSHIHYTTSLNMRIEHEN